MKLLILLSNARKINELIEIIKLEFKNIKVNYKEKESLGLNENIKNE